MMEIPFIKLDKQPEMKLVLKAKFCYWWTRETAAAGF